MRQKAKILVVEDEQDFREILEGLLRDEGYSVVAAGNGEEGLRLFALEEPDLLILDGQLPDLDGFDICNRIRTRGPRPDTPIILCTVRSETAPVAQGLASGATDYVVKPFDGRDLLKRVEAALRPVKDRWPR